MPLDLLPNTRLSPLTWLSSCHSRRSCTSAAATAAEGCACSSRSTATNALRRPSPPPAQATRRRGARACSSRHYLLDPTQCPLPPLPHAITASCPTPAARASPPWPSCACCRSVVPTVAWSPRQRTALHLLPELHSSHALHEPVCCPCATVVVALLVARCRHWRRRPCRLIISSLFIFHFNILHVLFQCFIFVVSTIKTSNIEPA